MVIEYSNSGHHAQPLIEGLVEVASIEIRSSATLTLAKNAQLTIDGTFTYSEGITIYGGNLVNKGIIHLINLDKEITSEFLSRIQNTGHCFVDGQALESHKPGVIVFSQPDNPNH